MKKILLFGLTLFAFSHAFAQTLVNHKGQDVFFSGINLAWISYAADLDNFDEAEFRKAMTDVSNAGGNSVRWWLHVDGTASPTFSGDKVSGIDIKELKNLKTALDIAAENHIVLSLCLWSFGMLNKTQNATILNRNRKLLQDSTYLAAYINNALIPMVNYVKGHTAIMCWEIFNEAEGMTPIGAWVDVNQVNISDVQTVVNRCAGAIHRTDTTVKVSTGVWNILALSDVVKKNYYTDARLISAGGDQDGTLDFYMVHYYPEWYGETHSPFHHPASYWQLDKPLVVAEFPAKGIVPLPLATSRFAPKTQLQPMEAYNWLYENGYAGALSWTWTNHDGFGGLQDITEAMSYLREQHPDSIIIKKDPEHNYIPEIIGKPKDTTVFVNADTIKDFINLNKMFTDDAEIEYILTTTGSAIAYIERDSMVSVRFIADSGGTSIITIYAKDTADQINSIEMNVNVIDTSSINHFFSRPVIVSSVENNQFAQFYATDGNTKTRWSTEYSDNEWLIIDMKETEILSRIKLSWEVAYAEKYEIFVSTDSSNWTSVYNETNSDGGIDNIIIEPVSAQFVRIVFTDRGTAYGYSLYEIEGYTDNGELTNSPPKPRNSSFSQKFYAEQNINFYFKTSFILDTDGDKLTYSLRMKDNSSFPDWFKFDNETLNSSGIPAFADTGKYVFVITGTDWFNQSAEYEVTFIVAPPFGTSLYDHSENDIIININNPVLHNRISISSNKIIQNCSITLKDITSLTCFRADNITFEKYDIPLSDLPKGSYIISIIAKDFVFNKLVSIN